MENQAKYGGSHRYEHVLKLKEIASDCEMIYAVDTIFHFFFEAFRFSRENIIE